MVMFRKVKHYPVGNVSQSEMLPTVSEKKKKKKKKNDGNVSKSETLPFGNVALLKRY
jgi:hypothetical protein